MGVNSLSGIPVVDLFQPREVAALATRGRSEEHSNHNNDAPPHLNSLGINPVNKPIRNSQDMSLVWTDRCIPDDENTPPSDPTQLASRK